MCHTPATPNTVAYVRFTYSQPEPQRDPQFGNLHLVAITPVLIHIYITHLFRQTNHQSFILLRHSSGFQLMYPRRLLGVRVQLVNRSCIYRAQLVNW